MLNINKKQFIISNNDLTYMDFKKVKINNKYILFDNRLNINFIKNKYNQTGVIIGECFSIIKDENPIEILKNNKIIDIQQAYKYWTGRYIIIWENELHLDAGGTLSCFYTKTSKNSYLISSSLNIINDIIEDLEEIKFNKIQHGVGMDFYPGPLTRYKNINRVLPSQFLKLNECIEVNSRKIIIDNFEVIDYESKLVDIMNMMTNAIYNIDKFYPGKIIVPLTSGYDSRTIFSACINSNISFSTMTMEHDGISMSDIKVPKEISNLYKINHEYIKKGKFSKEKMDEFDKHTFGCCVDTDRMFYCNNQLNYNSGKAILLRGGQFGIPKAYYQRKFGAANNKKEMMDILSERFTNIKESYYHKKSLEEWIEWINNNPEHIDWRDRLFIEQRVGAWNADIEQALDISDFDSINLINSQYILNLMLSLPLEERITSNCLKRLIELGANDLKKIPYGKITILDILRGELIVIKKSNSKLDYVKNRLSKLKINMKQKFNLR